MCRQIHHGLDPLPFSRNTQPRPAAHLRLLEGGAEQANVSDGPEVTLAGLYREHAAFVARLAFRLLGRDNDVDDVVHDVFLDLMRQLHTLQEPHELRGWLTTVTVRAVRRRLRRARLRQLVGMAEPSAFDEIVSSSATQEESAQLRAIYKALDKLPADQRLAWMLRHLEDEPLETVALRCQVSLATVKRKLNAANQRLRRELGAWIE